MSNAFDAAYDEFAQVAYQKNIDRFWSLYDTINLEEDEKQEWCSIPQYGLNLRTIFEAIEDEDWTEIQEEIERLNSYV